LGTLESQGIPVYRYEASETVGTSGLMTSGGTLLEAITLPSAMTITEGTLSIQIAPSLAAGMTDGLTYLEDFEHSCVEQTISRFLPNVISTRALRSAGLSDPELESNLQGEVNAALQRLVNWQNPDGGWGWWASAYQRSDVLTSAYVVLGLLEAEEAGYTIDPDVLEGGVSFLRGQVTFVRDLETSWKLNRQAFVIYVLARADSPYVSAAVQLFDQRQSMAIYAKAFLAQAFAIFDQLGAPEREQARRVLTRLREQMGEDAFQTDLEAAGEIPTAAAKPEGMTFEQIVDQVVDNTIAVFTQATDKKGEWWQALGQLQNQVKEQGPEPFATFLDLVLSLIEGASPEGLTPKVPQEYQQAWQAILDGIKE
jgi:uncharacterized protein YfaS (alpha-2-macroglobulin family)